MATKKVAELVGRRVVLRPLRQADLPMTLAWRNKERVRTQLVTSRPLSYPEHRRWFEHYARRDDDFLFIIETRPEGRPVGQVSLYDIGRDAGSAEFGRLILGEDDVLGKGLAVEASRLVVSFAFRDLGLGKISLRVFPTNSGAIALYETCGFEPREETGGLLRMELERAGGSP